MDISVEASSSKSFILNISKYYFPGWSGELDGKEVNLKPGKPFGQITVEIPSGAHSIKIFFKETPIRIVLDAISFLALLICVSLIFIRKNK